MKRNTAIALQKRITAHIAKYAGGDPDDISFLMGSNRYEIHFRSAYMMPYVLCRKQYNTVHVGNIVNGVLIENSKPIMK